MAAAFPEQTRSFSPMPPIPDSGLKKLSVPNFATLLRELRDPDLSLIVTAPSQLASWRLLMRTCSTGAPGSGIRGSDRRSRRICCGCRWRLRSR